MGKLLVNSVNVNAYIGDLYDNSDARTKASSVIGTKIKGFNLEIDSQSKKAVTGDVCDAFQKKLRYKGSTITIAPNGTRPLNQSETRIVGDNINKYLVNKNGLLVISDSNPADVGIDAITGLLPNDNRGVISTDKDKKVVVTVALWGAGGKGGGGAYYTIFMGPAGYYGGIGGGGAGKVFVKLEINNNAYCRIASSNKYKGRYTNDDTEPYLADECRMFDSSDNWIVNCTGGYSGIGAEGHSKTDSQINSGNGYWAFNSLSYIYEKNGIKCTLCMAAEGGVKANHGLGYNNSSEFKDKKSPYYGNPENNNGKVVRMAWGGKDTGYTSNKSNGSSGGGSYGTGGNAGDTGSGSAGSNGNAGSGGGGAGSPAGGANGGLGGYPGFSIFY